MVFSDRDIKNMTMDIKSLVRRAPVFYRILRACYRRGSGRLLGDKIDDVASRLARIERFLSSSPDLALGAGSISIVAQHALAALREPKGDSSPALAVVSILPPEKSGIAHFTFEAFSAAGYPVDFYSPRLNLASYLALCARLEVEGKRHRVFPLDLLSYGLSTLRYSACVFVLGNSEHNLPVYQAFKQLGRLAKHPIIHLHDPCLWNLVTAYKPSDSIEDVMRASYSDIPLSRGLIGIQEALDLGALGTRCLLDGPKRPEIIVNSAAARQLLERELPGAPVRTVFHPIFTMSNYVRPVKGDKQGSLSIGAFGIPGPEKCTDLVLEAFREVRAILPEAKLILAGYGAPAYVRTRNIGPEQGVFASEPEDTDSLVEIMASCDVAIQLRRRNLGESSGIMAQLMSAEIPTVAFDIGAFQDYRGAVRLIPHSSRAKEIAQAVIEVQDTSSQAKAMAQLIVERSASRFCQVFRDSVEDLTRAVPSLKTG